MGQWSSPDWWVDNTNRKWQESWFMITMRSMASNMSDDIKNCADFAALCLSLILNVRVVEYLIVLEGWTQVQSAY